MALTINIFYEQEFSQLCTARLQQITADIQSESAEYLLNVSEDDYKSHLVEQYMFDPLDIRFDEIQAEPREAMIPADRHPGSRFDLPGMQGRSFQRQVIRYFVPFDGDEVLLTCTPNPRSHATEEVRVENGHVSFDIIDFSIDAERLTRELNQIVGRIRNQLENLQLNVTEFNENLRNKIDAAFASRKEQLEARLGVVADLGVPIRKSEAVSRTFRVPTTRKKVGPKPQITTETGLPEPSLGEDVYREILQVIHDMGKVFERLPSTYAGKNETDLRDHLVMQLEPHFEGSTTGETFNKSGKTDILIRHENSNVFVAECKFWDGPQAHQDAIDQLLGYLTWRDSKTALVVFVDRRDFSAVLGRLAEATEAHGLFLARTSSTEESWTDYEFHLPDDPGRRIKMATLAFHLPAVE